LPLGCDAEIPSGFVRAIVPSPDRALEVAGAHAFLGLTEQQRSEKTLLQRQMGIIEDCASGNGELIVAIPAVEQLLGRLQFHDCPLQRKHSTPFGHRKRTKSSRHLPSVSNRFIVN
jgi:hypothetical protein